MLPTPLTPPADPERPPDPRRVVPTRIAGIYLAVGLLWIWLTDLALLSTDGQSPSGFRVAAGKGTLFVALSAGLIYGLVRGHLGTLAGQHRLLRAVTESTADAVFVKDRDGRYLLFNAAAARLVGKAVAEVLGRDDTALFDAETARRLADGDRRVMASGEVETREQPLTVDGTTRTVLATTAPYRDRDGAVIGVIGIVRDVTDRKRAEDELQAGELRYRTLVDHAADGICLHDANGIVVDANRAACEALGYTLDELVGMSPTDFDIHLPPARLARTLADLDAGRLVELNSVHRRKDGTTFPVEVRVRPCRVGGRRFGLAIVRDVTDRARAEAALRESEERFRATFEQAAVGITHVAPDGRFLRVNSRFADITGYTRDELMALRFHDITHPDDLAPDLDRDARLLAGTIPNYSVEKRYVRKGGGPVWVALTVSLRRAADGEPVHFISVVEDVSERRRAAEEVREARNMLRQVLDAVPHGIFWKDRSFRFLGCNRVVARSMGFDSPDALVGRTDADLVPITAAEAAAFARTDREVMEAGTPRLWVAERLTRADGRTAWLETNKVPLRDPDGRVVGVLGIWQDVTERRRTEDARRESEARFRNLVEVLPDAVYVNLSGRVAFCNPACVGLFGATAPDQLLGKSFLDLFHPDCHAVIRTRNETMLATGRPAPGLEERAVRLDGRAVPVYVRATPITDRGTSAILVVLHDLTERKRVELQLRQQELVLREAAELAHVGGWGYDPVTLKTDWTPEVARIYDLPEAAVPGLPDAMTFFDADQRDELAAALEAAGRSGTPHDLELKFTSAAGVKKWVRSICRPIVEGGTVVRVRGSIQDITDRKRAEAEIRQLNAELEQRVRARTAELEAANRELEAFSYSVSHDLRAPLRAVAGFARIVLDDYGSRVPDDARTYLADVIAGTRQMGRLIDDLLAFSRLNRQPVRRTRIDVTELVGNCLREVVSSAGGRRVDVRLGDLPPCDADPALLRQVWLNLLSNAVKYSRTRDPAAVEIGSRAGAGGAAYFVRDNGVGFDMRYAHKLFGVFQRLHRAEEYEGTGIGLALVQRIVHRHGGRVWAEAEPGAGATFSFTLGGGRDDGHPG
jgi:PAS domain S-box-containing protein